MNGTRWCFDGADYSAHLPKPRERQAKGAAATKELVTLFTTLDELFGNQLDPLMEKFKESNAGFYNEHRTARLLVDSGAARAGKPATDAAKSDTTANKSTKDGGTTKAA